MGGLLWKKIKVDSQLLKKGPKTLALVRNSKMSDVVPTRSSSPARARLSLRDLMYRRSKGYARRVYLAHLASTHQPVPRPSRELTARIDAVHSRLLRKYPFRLLL